MVVNYLCTVKREVVRKMVSLLTVCVSKKGQTTGVALLL